MLKVAVNTEQQLSSNADWTWSRVRISDALLQWWRRHKHPTAPFEGATEGVIRGEAPADLYWIHYERGKYQARVAVTPDGENPYDLRKAYEAACSTRDPLQAPHTMIRGLRNGNYADALEFLRNFGVLSMEPPDVRPDEVSRMPDMGPGKFPFDFDQFFRRRKRFVGIIGLWEALPDPERLRAAWQSVVAELEDIEQAGGPLLGEWLEHHLLAEDREARKRELTELAAASRPLRVKARIRMSTPAYVRIGIGNQPVSSLRRLAVRVIERELDATIGSAARWRAVSMDERTTFRLEVRPDSLWAMLWQCFAWDTDNGILWRICPHCGKVFAPPRRDRFYCTAKLQQLHSKRDWWDRNRRGLAGRRNTKE